MTEQYPWTPAPPPQELPPGAYPPPPPPQAYTYGYPGYGYPVARKTNGLAIASLVVSIASFAFCALLGCVGAILGHVARKQIAESGEDGAGLAKAGIIVGWIAAGLGLLVIVGYAIVVAFAVSHGQTLNGGG